MAAYGGCFSFVTDETAKAEGRAENVWRFPSPGLDVPKLAYIAIKEDFGDIVHGVFLAPERWNGKTIPATSELLSYDEVVSAFKKGMWGLVATDIEIVSLLTAWFSYRKRGTV